MKGSAVAQFRVGQHVTFITRKSWEKYAITETGSIVKLHRAGRQGSAEIRPSDGRAKVTRRLQHVKGI